MVASESFLVNFSLFCTVNYRAYTDSDCYIGLNRDVRACTCRGFGTASCEACRASWSWDDGTAMNWWNWQQEEPNEFACGRLSSDGWAENDCAEELRYICQRGKACCILIRVYAFSVGVKRYPSILFTFRRFVAVEACLY